MHDYVNLPRLKSDKNQALTQRRHATKAPLALAPFRSPLWNLDGWIIMAAQVEIGSFPIPRKGEQWSVGRGR